jgi:hypothetical protein
LVFDRIAIIITFFVFGFIIGPILSFIVWFVFSVIIFRIFYFKNGKRQRNAVKSIIFGYLILSIFLLLYLFFAGSVETGSLYITIYDFLLPYTLILGIFVFLGALILSIIIVKI